MNRDIYAFLDTKIRSLAARARRLARFDRHSVGIRPEDVPYSPSPAHFAAANARLVEIDRHVRRQLGTLSGALRRPEQGPDELLRRAALVEREIDRARRAYGLFFDVFIQRGTAFAPALAACDAIAADCFQVVQPRGAGPHHGAAAQAGDVSGAQLLARDVQARRHAAATARRAESVSARARALRADRVALGHGGAAARDWAQPASRLDRLAGNAAGRATPRLAGSQQHLGHSDLGALAQRNLRRSHRDSAWRTGVRAIDEGLPRLSGVARAYV